MQRETRRPATVVYNACLNRRAETTEAFGQLSLDLSARRVTGVLADEAVASSPEGRSEDLLVDLADAGHGELLNELNLLRCIRRSLA